MHSRRRLSPSPLLHALQTTAPDPSRRGLRWPDRAAPGLRSLLRSIAPRAFAIPLHQLSARGLQRSAISDAAPHVSVYANRQTLFDLTSSTDGRLWLSEQSQHEAVETDRIAGREVRAIRNEIRRNEDSTFSVTAATQATRSVSCLDPSPNGVFRQLAGERWRYGRTLSRHFEPDEERAHRALLSSTPGTPWSTGRCPGRASQESWCQVVALCSSLLQAGGRAEPRHPRRGPARCPARWQYRTDCSSRASGISALEGSVSGLRRPPNLHP